MLPLKSNSAGVNVNEAEPASNYDANDDGNQLSRVEDIRENFQF